MHKLQVRCMLIIEMAHGPSKLYSVLIFFPELSTTSFGLNNKKYSAHGVNTIHIAETMTFQNNSNK